ncbi:MAG TPA: WbuC family cupin fold metalloprotein [Thermoanaerobaculia bacterium]|nr:WbuC family cupin fold metalloprotein [Thermoanaerobaculia bacterium]
MNGPPRAPAWITRETIRTVSREAASSPRRRKNRNLHAMEDPVHRLLNGMEPGTYVRPHRHLHPPKSETALVVAGRIGILFFDDAGSVLERRALEAGGETIGADFPPEAWHTLVALSPGSVFFETKAGPYAPPPEADLASWSPPEGSADAARLELLWRGLFDAR